MKSYTTPSFKFVGRGTGVKVKEQVLESKMEKLLFS